LVCGAADTAPKTSLIIFTVVDYVEVADIQGGRGRLCSYSVAVVALQHRNSQLLRLGIPDSPGGRIRVVCRAVSVVVPTHRSVCPGLA